MPEPFDPYHVWLGIPPEEQPPNHYRLLGLRPLETNADVISNALDQRRAFLRSVQAGKRAAQSQQLLNEVSAAGVALLDPVKKTQYDAELRKKLSPRPVAAAHPAGLPDPMAPLAISDLMPQQRAAAAPGGRNGSSVATMPPPPSATPVIVSPPLRRGSGKRTSSSTQFTAMVVSGAAVALALIGVFAWWKMKGSSPADVSAAPAVAATSLPPALPPRVPVESKSDESPDQAGGAFPSPAATAKNDSKTAIATNVPRSPAVTTTPPASSPPQGSSPPQPESAPAGGAAAAAKSAAIGGRQPVPAGPELSKAEEAARKLFAKELKEATKPPQQVALGNEIYSAGRATQNDATDRFALIDLARTLFIEAGEVTEALKAARLLELEYDIPRDQLQTSTIEALENGPVIPEYRLMLTRTAAELADSAVDAQDFERAEKLATIALQSGGKLRDADLKKDLIDRRNSIQRLVKEWNTVKPSLEKLKSDPSDAAANLVAGKFYCFSLEDFHRGLPYLAASGEGLLAEAAKLDGAAQTDSTKRYQAAHAWQKAELKIVDREDKLAAQRRERWLLQQAVAGLTGIEEIEVKKRLAQLQNVGSPAGGRKAADVPAPVMPAKTKKKSKT